MNSIKNTWKDIRETAVQIAEGRGLNPEELPNRNDALLILAIAALKEIEKENSSSEITSNAKSARQLLRSHISRVTPLNQENEEKEEKSVNQKRKRLDVMDEDNRNNNNDSNSNDKEKVDLGQYAHTDVFDGNDKKRTKFARLMGGGKHEGSAHNTFAADTKTIKRINGDLEEQYNTALSRHGKKGLGA